MTRYHCCYNCKNRTIGCHSTCEMYLNEKKEHLEDIKKNKYKYGYAGAELSAQRRTKSAKMFKDKNHKR